MVYSSHSPEVRRCLLLADYLMELYKQKLIPEDGDTKDDLLPQIEKDITFIEADLDKRHI